MQYLYWQYFRNYEWLLERELSLKWWTLNSGSSNISNTSWCSSSDFQIPRNELKNEAKPSFLTSFEVSRNRRKNTKRVFEITSQTNQYFRRKSSRKLEKFSCNLPPISKYWLIMYFFLFLLYELLMSLRILFKVHMNWELGMFYLIEFLKR